jgi:peptidoglycan/xylan/chitin deacetylase (PgdA/CDA1 family)
MALLYHAVMPAPNGADREERRLFVSPQRFERQMTRLLERGFHCLTLDAFAAALRAGRAPRRSFLLTFDDAYAHVDQAVTPILRRHGLTAVMFVPVAHMGVTNTWDREHPHLGWPLAGSDQLRSMAAGPWELASHGLRHVDLRDCEPYRRRRELAQAREILAGVGGRCVTELAYPYGAHDAGVREDARAAGYRIAFEAVAGHAPSLFALPRRAVGGTDSAPIFRFKTATAGAAAYSVHRWLRDHQALVRRQGAPA